MRGVAGGDGARAPRRRRAPGRRTIKRLLLGYLEAMACPRRYKSLDFLWLLLWSDDLVIDLVGSRLGLILSGRNEDPKEVHEEISCGISGSYGMTPVQFT